MTSEKRLLFGLDDIRGIVFECPKCKGRITLSPDREKQASDFIACPGCNASWFGPDYENAAPYAALLRAIAVVRGLIDNAPPPMAVRLEFDDAS